MSDYRNLIGTPPTSHSPSTTSVKSHLYPLSNDTSITTAEMPTSSDLYLRLLEPSHVRPPDYGSLPPGGCPRFPVMDNWEKTEELPSYSPAAYKVCFVSRKPEWISPYEPSPLRSWKNVIIELNSTQLNIFQVPKEFEPLVRYKQQMPLWSSSSSPEQTSSNYCSVFTSQEDKNLHTMIRNFGLVAPEFIRPSSNTMGCTISPSLHPKQQKYLLRSYSLQHAKIGLASDYPKKPNVLRLRLENEQFLLHFNHPQEMIDWNLALSVGRDVSSDILIREMPRYRTVPRRRRNRSNLTSDLSLFNAMITVKRKSRPSLEGDRIKNKFWSFRGMLSLNSGKHTNSEDELKIQKLNTKNVPRTTPLTDIYQESDISNEEVVSECVQESLADDENQEDIRNLSDLTRSDDEEEDGFDEESMAVLSHFDYRPQDEKTSEDTFKWNPPKRPESERKILRNTIKCIKPLGFNESWSNKVLVKVSPTSQITLMINVARKDHEWNYSRSSMTTANPETRLQKMNYGSLAKTPHHNLTEFIVGAHALIPREV